MSRLLWDDASDARLLALRAEGKTLDAIGQVLDRGHSSIANRLALLKKRQKVAAEWAAAGITAAPRRRRKTAYADAPATMAPRESDPRFNKARRTCLGCGREFLSEFCGNRLCGRCKGRGRAA